MVDYDALFAKRKRSILQTPDKISVKGSCYYVSQSGDDRNDGRSPETAWKSLERVSCADLKPGDGVLFARGEVFRGSIRAKSGVTYAAYGVGEKPQLLGSEMDLADPKLWELYEERCHIYRLKQKVLDVGTLVFDGEALHSRKLIPSFRGMKFVCREDEAKDFVLCEQMTEDLDLFWEFAENLKTTPSKGEDFPIPDVWNDGNGGCLGTLFLRCDKGNPGEVFSQIEALSAVNMFAVGTSEQVTIDNLCIKYVGRHGVSAGLYAKGLHVQNCVFGWIGGVIQMYDGTDPNYPEGRRGSVTRYGNAIEVYGGCEDYVASNNYIYEVYDAGITHQMTTAKPIRMQHIRYTDNLIERCVYGIEYFLDQIEGERESKMEDVIIEDNFIRLSGYGWGQQRHNVHTPAAIKGWSYVNTAKDFVIRHNIFDRSAYRLLHLVALKDEYCPNMQENVYIQPLDGMLGQYGGNEVAEPEMLYVDESAAETVKDVFKDTKATVVAG